MVRVCLEALCAVIGNKMNAPAERVNNDLSASVWRENPDLIRDFLDQRNEYELLCVEVEYILRQLTKRADVEVSGVFSRAKTLNSFLSKIQRKTYEKPLADITDFAGVRVVCLYHSDVSKVCDAIRTEFIVEEEVDKLDELGVNRFGYGAQHLIVRLGRSSSGARYDDLKLRKCEIQVRTVVQDAWAIIQHHLMYKQESEVPMPIQRKLNSLAGLFETVDDQFEHIKNDRLSYIAQVTTDVNAGPLDIALNLDSLEAFLLTRFPDRPTGTGPGQLSSVLNWLKKQGLKNLAQVQKILDDTETDRALLTKDVEGGAVKNRDVIPSNVELALALSLTERDGGPVTWSLEWQTLVNTYRKARGLPTVAHPKLRETRLRGEQSSGLVKRRADARQPPVEP